jgi:hypothetical protein
MLTIRCHVAYPIRPKPVVKNNSSRKWTLDEDQTLDDLHRTKSWVEIGKILGRTRSSVRKRAQSIGIRKRGNDDE